MVSNEGRRPEKRRREKKKAWPAGQKDCQDKSPRKNMINKKRMKGSLIQQGERERAGER